MNFLKLTSEKLAIEAISDLVAHDACGAISFFAGTTRDNFEDKKVISLEYEAYEPMAVKQMEKICNLIRERWPDVVNIAIFHRLGLVPVREASVVIAISSPHRRSSLDAVSVAIEELKKLVPIWKKEKYDGDESSWKENNESSKGERTKRLKTDFHSCAITEIENIPKNLVQIAANENEINRRIQCFVEKKREEIDLNNIMDFTSTKRSNDFCDDGNEKESTCARTNSIIIKQEDSTCHLRVRRVKNRIGPQIRPDYLHTLDKLMTLKKTQAVRVKEEPVEPEQDSKEIRDASDLSYGLHNRLSDIEQHLDIKTTNTSQVYKRIKDIENRLMHLESISPEYKHFLNEKITSTCATPGFGNIKYENMCSSFLRKIYSVNELDSMIDELKQSYSDDDEEGNTNNELQS